MADEWMNRELTMKFASRRSVVHNVKTRLRLRMIRIMATTSPWRSFLPEVSNQKIIPTGSTKVSFLRVLLYSKWYSKTSFMYAHPFQNDDVDTKHIFLTHMLIQASVLKFWWLAKPCHLYYRKPMHIFWLKLKSRKFSKYGKYIHSDWVARLYQWAVLKQWIPFGAKDENPTQHNHVEPIQLVHVILHFEEVTKHNEEPHYKRDIFDHDDDDIDALRKW